MPGIAPWRWYSISKQGATVDTLESIDVAVVPGALQPIMYPEPKTGLEANFSMPYAVAAAFVDERIGIETFETDATQRSSVKKIIERVHAWRIRSRQSRIRSRPT